jgi:hypothetical protein
VLSLPISFNRLLIHVTTSNYSTIANSHTHRLRFSSSQNKSFSVCCVFTSHCLPSQGETGFAGSGPRKKRAWSPLSQGVAIPGSLNVTVARVTEKCYFVRIDGARISVVILLTYCRVYEWLQTGFGLVIRFIARIYTQLGTTSNYSAIANSHTLQFTTACTKPSQSALSSRVIAW